MSETVKEPATEKVHYDELVGQSKRSYRFRVDNRYFWVAKELIDDWSTEQKTFYIPISIYEKHFI
jgi:hypothetical protein